MTKPATDPDFGNASFRDLLFGSSYDVARETLIHLRRISYLHALMTNAPVSQIRAFKDVSTLGKTLVMLKARIHDDMPMPPPTHLEEDEDPETWVGWEPDAHEELADVIQELDLSDENAAEDSAEIQCSVH